MNSQMLKRYHTRFGKMTDDEKTEKNKNRKKDKKRIIKHENSC